MNRNSPDIPLVCQKRNICSISSVDGQLRLIKIPCLTLGNKSISLDVHTASNFDDSCQTKEEERVIQEYSDQDNDENNDQGLMTPVPALQSLSDDMTPISPQTPSSPILNFSHTTLGILHKKSFCRRLRSQMLSNSELTVRFYSVSQNNHSITNDSATFWINRKQTQSIRGPLY